MRDRQTGLLLLTIATVLVCTGYVAHSRAEPRGLALLAPPAQPEATRALRAVVVFRLGDCDSRIDFMHMFERPRWKGAFSTGAIVIGSVKDAKAAAQLLRARGLAFPVSSVGGASHPGRFLGYDSTPYLLIVDRQGRVRSAIPGPASAAELRALERAAESLLDPVPPPD